MLPPASQSQSMLLPVAGPGHSLELALETSELRYRRLFETAQDGILILDAIDGKIMDANPFVLDLLDYPFDSVIGLQLWEIGLFEDIEANKAAFHQLQSAEYIRYENHPLRTRSGKVIPVEFVSNVYFVGPERVIQCNIRDISRRVEIQAAARSEVAALEVAGRAKDEVIAVLSHELRTPLAAISSTLDVVELCHDMVGQVPHAEMPPQFSQSALRLIRRNVQTLVRLITELLDLTHLTKGSVQLTLDTVDAHSVIAAVLTNLEAELKAKEIALDQRLLAQHSHILADATKVEQVLSNLIGNAVKFTARGGSVSIVTRNEGGTRLVVEVSDTGIGISSEALGRIFSPFEQGDASIHGRFGGLGLGLAIARKLMDAQGGTLEAASQGLGHGSVFTARFALDEALATVITPAPPSSTTIVPPARAGVGIRVLLVEDNEDARRALSALLGSLGYELREAVGVQEALELGARESFDLLITDLGLRDGSGIQLLPAIRQHSPALVGIAITGYSSAQDLVDSRQAGFAAHLVKPIRFAELRQQLELSIPEARAAALRLLRE